MLLSLIMLLLATLKKGLISFEENFLTEIISKLYQYFIDA